VRVQSAAGAARRPSKLTDRRRYLTRGDSPTGGAVGLRRPAVVCTGTRCLRILRGKQEEIPRRGVGRNSIEIRQILHANFFGRELPVANQTVQLPLMVITQAIRLPGPEPLWEVEILPTAGDSAPVHFVLAPLDDAAQQAA
jgi:hypothetical protein